MNYMVNELNREQTGHSDLSRLFAVLSDPTRLAVLETVARESTVKGYLVDVNGLNKATVHSNLKLLKKFGFINGCLTSGKLFYFVNYQKIDEFKRQFDTYYELIGMQRLGEEKSNKKPMYTPIKRYLDELAEQFGLIPENRKENLRKLSGYIAGKQAESKQIRLVYVCTHNSRRSHFGQVWSQVAAHYYNVQNVVTFSGGTEATAFNSDAINALKRIGFEVKQMDTTDNPLFQLSFDENKRPVICFSKVYDHPDNPQSEFAAVMTCSDAEENCPFIPGVELRIGTTYDDPKEFDNTPLQDAKYDERCRQIALETLYVFSLIQ